jgi:hypothetical protein
MFNDKVYTPQVNDRLRGGTEKSAFWGTYLDVHSFVSLFKIVGLHYDTMFILYFIVRYSFFKFHHSMLDVQRSMFKVHIYPFRPASFILAPSALTSGLALRPCNMILKIMVTTTVNDMVSPPGR